MNTLNTTPAQSSLALFAPPAQQQHPAAKKTTAATAPAPKKSDTSNAPQPQIDAAASLAALFGGIGEAAANASRAAIAPELDAIRAEMQSIAAQAAKNAAAPVVEFRFPERPEPVKLPDGETAHPALEKLLARIRYGWNVYLLGPTGSGKTHLAAQAAAVLFPDRDPVARFGTLSVSGEISAGDIFGRLEPEEGTGRLIYRPSRFVEIYRNGGVFLFDEFDAAIPSTLQILNQATANGTMTIPWTGEVVKRNPDCVLIAAGNTNGEGATADYTGRERQDAASLNRFHFLRVDYDTDLEKRLALAYAGDERRANIVLEARDKARSVKNKRRLLGAFFSTRTVIDFARAMRAEAFGNAREILEDFCAGMGEETRAAFLAS